jgi:hypothetical protein
VGTVIQRENNIREALNVDIINSIALLASNSIFSSKSFFFWVPHLVLVV